MIVRRFLAALVLTAIPAAAFADPTPTPLKITTAVAACDDAYLTQLDAILARLTAQAQTQKQPSQAAINAQQMLLMKMEAAGGQSQAKTSVASLKSELAEAKKPVADMKDQSPKTLDDLTKMKNDIQALKDKTAAHVKCTKGTDSSLTDKKLAEIKAQMDALNAASNKNEKFASANSEAIKQLLQAQALEDPAGAKGFQMEAKDQAAMQQQIQAMITATLNFLKELQDSKAEQMKAINRP